MTTLQKGQFELIAHTIRTLPFDKLGIRPQAGFIVRSGIAEHFANRLEGTNPIFDREKFIEWATVRPLNKF